MTLSASTQPFGTAPPPKHVTVATAFADRGDHGSTRGQPLQAWPGAAQNYPLLSSVQVWLSLCTLVSCVGHGRFCRFCLAYAYTTQTRRSEQGGKAVCTIRDAFALL